MLFLPQNFEYGYPTQAIQYGLVPIIAQYLKVKMSRNQLEF